MMLKELSSKALGDRRMALTAVRYSRFMKLLMARFLLGQRGAGIFRSTDNGNIWTPVNTGLHNEPGGRGRSMDVTAIAEKGNEIYVGIWNTLYFSTDIGDTWQRVSAIRTPGEISDIVILDDYIYVSALHGTGVWQSKDGNSWTQINDGLGITFHGGTSYRTTSL